MFTESDITNLEESIEELKGIIQQLKEENSLSATLSSQREANSWMIERLQNTIKLQESKIRYIKLELADSTPSQPSLLDKRLHNPSSPRTFLA
ncbi:hypothetical protein [Priestia megaterium]|uniref:hypothetical protein n=1 Tax=Priestia megaterium TaxID=1404 RepID=UPI0039B053FF